MWYFRYPDNGNGSPSIQMSKLREKTLYTIGLEFCQISNLHNTGDRKIGVGTRKSACPPPLRRPAPTTTTPPPAGGGPTRLDSLGPAGAPSPQGKKAGSVGPHRRQRQDPVNLPSVCGQGEKNRTRRRRRHRSSSATMWRLGMPRILLLAQPFP
jgi:hypothetical protein